MLLSFDELARLCSAGGLHAGAVVDFTMDSSRQLQLQLQLTYSVI